MQKFLPTIDRQINKLTDRQTNKDVNRKKQNNEQIYQETNKQTVLHDIFKSRYFYLL